jgi:hypothetical protein
MYINTQVTTMSEKCLEGLSKQFQLVVLCEQQKTTVNKITNSYL